MEANARFIRKQAIFFLHKVFRYFKQVAEQSDEVTFNVRI